MFSCRNMRAFVRRAVPQTLQLRLVRHSSSTSFTDLPEPESGFHIPLSSIQEALPVIRASFPETPILAAPRLSKRFGMQIFLKLDTVTPTKTFKARGALNRVSSLLKEKGSANIRGVITASAGNHGMSVAFAARQFGLAATVCVPSNANPQKVEAIERFGARIIKHGADYFEAYQKCEQLAKEEGLEIVHAYDHPDVIAGQGTIGLEIADYVAKQQRLPHPTLPIGGFDGVLCGIGGGGMISGVASALKQLPQTSLTRVMGVQPMGALSMLESLEAGRVVTLDKVETIADGLASRAPGKWTLEISRRLLDGIAPVSDQDMIEACRLLMAEERIIAEPAGAAGLAALLRYGQSIARLAIGEEEGEAAEGEEGGGCCGGGCGGKGKEEKPAGCDGQGGCGGHGHSHSHGGGVGHHNHGHAHTGHRHYHTESHSHGHSHGGVPCGHSHGGVPCGHNHGGPEAEESDSEVVSRTPPSRPANILLLISGANISDSVLAHVVSPTAPLRGGHGHGHGKVH